MISLTIPAGNVEKGNALIARVQQTWRWNTALQKPQHLLEIIRHLVLQKQCHILGEVDCELIAQEVVGIFWEGQDGSQHKMTIGNAGIQHRDECSWWTIGPNSLKQLRAWKECVQQCYTAGSQKPPVMITIADCNISMVFEGSQRKKNPPPKPYLPLQTRTRHRQSYRPHPMCKVDESQRS
jgi:hypothetical protein